MDDVAPAPPLWPPPLWRRLRRHAATLLLTGLYCAIVAPTAATVLLALRANGLDYQIVFSLMLAPLAIALGGPGAFVLGVIFGWMLLALAAQGFNNLPVRLALALMLATIAWWLAEPLPTTAQEVAPASLSADDWLIWAGSAAATATLFTRGWVARRLRTPLPLPSGD